MASEYPFHIQTQPRGYQEKVAPDLVNETWLCRGTQNMLLARDGTVQSRKGMTPKGTAGGSGTAAIRWADTWQTNTGVERAMRSRHDEFQCYYDDDWITIKSGFGALVRFDGAPWWDKTEVKDKYIFVNGTNQMFSWNGGITEALSGTATTLTKKFIVGPTTGVNTAVFDATAKTITASWADFVAAGFEVGDTIVIAGGGSTNVGTYTLQSVTTTVLTVIPSDTLINETNTGTVAAPTATVSNADDGSLTASTTYYYRVSAVDAFGGETLASTEVSAATTTSRRTMEVQWTQVAGAVKYNVYRSTTSGVYTTPSLIASLGGLSFTDDGSASLQAGTVPGAASSGMYIAVDGRATWNNERFSTQSIQFTINGGSTVYTATGGINSPTLTGITPNLPAITPGDIITTPIIPYGPTGGDIPSVAEYDILDVSKNQVLLGSTQRREVFFSKQDNFKSFAYTTPVRVAGDGGTVTLDNRVKSIDVSDEGAIHVTAGIKDIYKITLESTTSGDTPGEELKVEKIKNSTGQAANNHRAVTNTKNGLVYYSTQPSIDYLARVAQITTQQGVPLSDPISQMLFRLDATNVDSIYHQDVAFFLLPAEGMLLMYDMERELWQPPQLVAGSCLSVVENELTIHSAVESTSYTMFRTLLDDGAPINFAAVFNYRNGDTRAEYKTADKYFVELRMNQATEDVIATVDLGYNGAVSSQSATFGANDGLPYTEPPASFGGTGVNPTGSTPTGGFYADVDYDDELGAVSKYRGVIALPALGTEFFEMRFSITCDTPGAFLQILSHGENMVIADTVISNLIKT